MIKANEANHWRRSKRCSTGACVEVAQVEDRYLIRDSKNPDGAPLAFDREAWENFLAGVKSDEFGHA